ncbi:WhiB family transcriptional regulator [Nocardia sp. JCM 34519.1]|uniref:WhiB family transcriptional regulator n=1 Tax=unclassified Nocardia TaxID=2637762 RepID=UPI0035A99CD3
MNRDWMVKAACRGVYDPFFDDDLSADAKEWCATCPVWRECLAHALVSGEDHGVWGGFTAAERRALRKCLRLTAGRGRGAAARRALIAQLASAQCPRAAAEDFKREASRRAAS